MHSAKSAQTWIANATIACALAITVACASARRPIGAPHPIAVEVQNNLRLPTALTLYIVTSDGGRQILGDVPPAATRTFQYTPPNYTDTYRLIATRPLGRAVRSEPFTILSEMTGQIVWTMVPNVLGFRDIDTDSTGTQ